MKNEIPFTDSIKNSLPLNDSTINKVMFVSSRDKCIDCSWWEGIHWISSDDGNDLRLSLTLPVIQVITFSFIIHWSEWVPKGY
jgi:hypothetical protein